MEHPDRPGRDLRALRTVTSGGATVPVELVRNVEATLGVRFTIIFGQTEASPCITGTHLDDTPEDKAETLGQPLPQTEVRIIDPATGETLPTGAVGELCTRGYLVMAGYYNMPEATAEAIDAEGWLHTGDLASMDERGYCRIEGRLKDMIIRGGENIYPREIEELLFTHPAVGDVADRGRALRLRPRPPRPLQGAEALDLLRQLPDHAVGQGAEERPARPSQRGGKRRGGGPPQGGASAPRRRGGGRPVLTLHTSIHRLSTACGELAFGPRSGGPGGA